MQAVGGHPAPVAPAYDDGCVTGLVPALMQGDLVPGGWPSWLPDEVLGARRTLLLVLDGLGWEQLRSRPETAPNLTGFAGGAITTVAPSTTPCSCGTCLFDPSRTSSTISGCVHAGGYT